MSLKLHYYLRQQTTLDEEQLDKVIACFRPTSVPANTLLLAQGQTARALYFVHTGCVRSYYLTQAGHEKTRYIAFEDSIITSLASFIAQRPSFEFVDTVEDATLYAITHHDFFRLVAELPAWEKFYRTLLETAYVYQNRKIEDLVTLSAQQRFEQVRKHQPQYVQRLSNRLLASYLDIRPETLSRAKSKKRF